jgi:hypothetical protein
LGYCVLGVLGIVKAGLFFHFIVWVQASFRFHLNEMEKESGKEQSFYTYTIIMMISIACIEFD